MSYYTVHVSTEEYVLHDTYQVLNPDGVAVYSSNEWHSHETAYELAALLNYRPLLQELGTSHPFVTFYRRMIAGYAFLFADSSDIRYSSISYDLRLLAREIEHELTNGLSRSN